MANVIYDQEEHNTVGLRPISPIHYPNKICVYSVYIIYSMESLTGVISYKTTRAEKLLVDAYFLF